MMETGINVKSLRKCLGWCNVPYSAYICDKCPYRERGLYNCVEQAMRDADKLLEKLTAEGQWVYCPDDEGRPRWKCSRCGKIVHKDPAEKLYCAACGQRNRKEA